MFDKNGQSSVVYLWSVFGASVGKMWPSSDVVLQRDEGWCRCNWWLWGIRYVTLRPSSAFKPAWSVSANLQYKISNYVSLDLHNMLVIQHKTYMPIQVTWSVQWYIKSINSWELQNWNSELPSDQADSADEWFPTFFQVTDF